MRPVLRTRSCALGITLSLLAVMVGCGGGGGGEGSTPPPTVVSVSITTPVNLNCQRFGEWIPSHWWLLCPAAVAPSVTWTVNGVTNGNATFGTITGTGLTVTYNAPTTVPSPATFNVTATSGADSTKSASVSVTITAGVAVSITSPTSPQTVDVNATLSITASVTNTSNTAVTWTVNGATNGNSTFGTISGSGLTVTYKAPAAVPSPASFKITATGQGKIFRA